MCCWRILGILTVLLTGWVACAADTAGNLYSPLWLYNGTWRVTRQNLAPGAKPDELINQCVLVGKYFTCQQVVNGEVGALLVIVPAGKTGHYYTQNVGLDGRATGRGEMQIDGDRWTYNTIWNQGGTSTYYKTIHTFTGGDRIHFEQLESKNNKDWKTTNSGDEIRIGRAARR
jgi:hypothetical protein